MNQNEYREKYNEYKKLVNESLSKIEFAQMDKNSPIAAAVKYSLGAGGKRVRPVLTLAVCDMLGGDMSEALIFACAIEMIHTFSLIYDDLPAFDNDDYRRGMESSHKRFGESTAILAGGVLALFPMQYIAENVPPYAAAAAISELCRATLIDGMIGGQYLDKAFEGGTPGIAQILDMYSLKTGALLQSACNLGCMAAGDADEDLKVNVECYGVNLGLLFQLTDDILDETGEEKALGKPSGSDKRNQKNTLLKYWGMEHSKRKAVDLSDNAVICLKNLEKSGKDTGFLEQLIMDILHRDR